MSTAEARSGAEEEVRRRLAEAQARVLAALVDGAETPEGFDPERMRVQAVSLVVKRRSVVARMRPDAARAAGDGLAREFAAYAAARTAPPPGYHADADDFAAWLRAKGLLLDEPSATTEPRLGGEGTGWWRRAIGRLAGDA